MAEVEYHRGRICEREEMKVQSNLSPRTHNKSGQRKKSWLEIVIFYYYFILTYTHTPQRS